jgi:hypothetical protein
MSRRSGFRAALGVAAALLVSLVPLARVTAQSGGISTAMFSSLKWRMVGPFRGGRVNAVTGVPGQPNTFYFGSVGGGLWKSDNAGRTWNPIMDSATSASIGAIAVA